LQAVHLLSEQIGSLVQFSLFHFCRFVHSFNCVRCVLAASVASKSTQGIFCCVRCVKWKQGIKP